MTKKTTQPAKTPKKAVKNAEKPSDSQEVATGTITTTQIVLAALILPVILLGVWYGTTYFSGAESYTYNGFEFRQVPCEIGQCWETTVVSNIGEHPILFMHGPQEVQDIPVDPLAVERVLNLTRYQNTSAVIAFDQGVPGEVGIAATNIARITGERFYRIPTTGAVYGQTVTCDDATPMNTVVYLTQASETGVVLSDDCVLVIAENTTEIVRVADAYTLHLLQIMQ